MVDRRDFLVELGLALGTIGAMRIPEATVVTPVPPMVPELWAKESLRILQEGSTMGSLVHRDRAALFADRINVCQ